MPVSVAIALLVLVVAFLAIEPHLRRRHVALEPTPDRVRVGLDAPPLSPTFIARPGDRLPPIPDECYPPGAQPLQPLPASYEQLPGHRRYQQLAAVIPPAERPYDAEIDGL